MRRLLIWCVVAYQRCVSPFSPPACRFVPTCSQYAVEAIEIHGPLKGCLLAAWRILRCHPFHPGGLDPVPPARNKSPKEQLKPHGF